MQVSLFPALIGNQLPCTDWPFSNGTRLLIIASSWRSFFINRVRKDWYVFTFVWNCWAMPRRVTFTCHYGLQWDWLIPSNGLGLRWLFEVLGRWLYFYQEPDNDILWLLIKRWLLLWKGVWRLRMSKILHSSWQNCKILKFTFVARQDLQTGLRKYD